MKILDTLEPEVYASVHISFRKGGLACERPEGGVVTANLKTLLPGRVCSEQEFEKLLRRSEEHLKTKRPTELKVVPPPKSRRDTAA